MADDFSFNQLDKAWTYFNPGGSYMLPVYEFDVQDHELDHGTKLLIDVSVDNYRLETQIAKDSFENSKGYHGGLCVYRDGQNYLILGLSNGDRACVYGVVGGRTLAKMAAPESSLLGTYRYFALEKKQSTFSFFASYDGVTWEALPSTFEDREGMLQDAMVGLMNRYIGRPADVFHSMDKEIRSWFVEYAFFKIDGQRIPFPSEGREDWILRKSLGVFSMPVRSGATGQNAPRLLRAQKSGDWTLEGMISYNSASAKGNNLAGLALYVDDNNYLVFGIRNGCGNTVRLELSGMLNGQPTGPLIDVQRRYEADRTLRISKRHQDGSFPVYYFYGFGNHYAGKYEDVAGVFDSAQYGAMAWEATGGDGEDYVVTFEHISDMIRDAYADYFDSKALDGMWDLRSGTAQIGRARLVLRSDPADRPAVLLRSHSLQEDWMIDTTLTNLVAGSRAGLVLAGTAEALFYTYDGNTLGLQNGTESRALKPEERVNHLRVVRQGNRYIFRYSDSGCAWKTAFEHIDEAGALDDTRYGLVAQKQGTFLQFLEGLRPTGAIAEISSIEMICALTGEDGINKTQSRWGMGSTDLGSMFRYKDKIYGLYGDTFSQQRGEGAWIHNALSVGTTTDPAEGIQFEQVYIGKDGRGLVLPVTTRYACAMIPSCGFGIEEDGVDVLYMWVHEIYGWTTPGHRDVQGSGWAVSLDGGRTWRYDGAMFDGNSPFQFVTAYQDGDMLYLFGNAGSGYGETYLMRVAAKDVRDRAAYTFFAGIDEQGRPIWSEDEQDATWVLEQSNREIGIVYNQYLGVFLMTGLDTINDQVVVHESPTLYGPWSRASTLFHKVYMPVMSAQDKMPHCYGAFSLPSMVSEDGKTMYFTISQFRPYQVHWMGVTFEKSDLR